MNIKKISLICISIVVIISVFIFTACGAQKKQEINDNKQESKKEEVITEVKDIEETPIPSPTIIYYDVKLVDEKRLILYEVNGDATTEIKSINIDTSYYPQDDVDKLKNGISAFSKEDGYQILENFAN